MRWFRRKIKKLHHRHKKHTAMLMGVGIMLTGSILATAHFHWLEWAPVFIVDGVAYFMHGVGAIPFIHGIEPLWLLLIGE